MRELAEPGTKKDRHVFVVCKGDSCRRAGSDEILEDLRHRCRRPGADLRIGASKCLGHCGLAPTMVEDGQVLGAVSRRRIKLEMMRLGLE
jgi:NADH:ubiquinone oxidoreductase subunit E